MRSGGERLLVAGAGDAGAGDGLAGVVGEAAADAAGVDEGPAEPVSARAWSMTA